MGNSRTKNSLMNMAASIGYQMLNLVLSFVSRTIFLQVLGVGYLGINGLFNDVLSMLNMAELGLGTAMTYSMYKPLAENDHDTLAALTNFYKKVYRIIAFTIATIGVLLVPFLPYLINLESPIPNVELYYLLFLASNVASYFVVAKTTVLYADQKNYIMLQHGAVWRIAEIVMMLLVLYITKSYALYLITQVLFVYGRNFYMSHLADKYYPYLNKKVVLSREKTNGIFKDVGSAFIYKIANVLITGTDNTLISILVSTEMVGFFSNYQIITSKIGTVVSTIFSSLITSIGNMLAKEDNEKPFQVFQIMQSICLIMTTFFTCCIILLQEDFIRIWLGEEYVLGLMALLAISCKFYLNISMMPVSSYREAAGLFRKTKYLMFCTALINIILSIVLGRLIGLRGIIFATSISKLLTSFWYEPKLLFENYFKKASSFYFIQMLKAFVSLVIIIAVTWLMTKWFIPNNWIELICKGILVSIVCFILTILFYYRTIGFKLAISKMKSMIRID